MKENPPTNESNAEKILNERKVLKAFDEIIDGGYEILRSLENEEGLYILEVQTIDEDGDKVLFHYIREGSYPESFSKETVIDVTFFMDNMPVGGYAVAKYKDGVWIPEAD